MHACELKGVEGHRRARTPQYILMRVSLVGTRRSQRSLMMNYKAARVVRVFVWLRTKVAGRWMYAQATIWMDVFSGHEASRQLD